MVVKPITDDLVSAINSMAAVVHDNAEAHGFWRGGPRNKAEMIALMHSELSEALEFVRKPGADDHVPELNGESAEMADVLIRVLDYCFGHGIDIGKAIQLKHRFNMGRPHMHGKAF